MKFNLEQFLKEAMGAPAWRYRSQIKWCRLEDAVRGNSIATIESDENDPNSPVVQLTWSQLKAKRENGVRNALFEILNFRAKVDAIFEARYGLSEEKLREMFQVMVGYHPFYGVYMCSVGPYYASDTLWKSVELLAKDRPIDNSFLDEKISEFEQRLSQGNLSKGETNLLISDLSACRSVKADVNNRFGFFTKRHQRANQKEIQKSAMNFVKASIEELSKVMDVSDIKLGPEDLRFILKKATGGLRGEETCAYNADIYEGLNDESPDAQDLFRKRPVIGADSSIEIKPNVLTKIILKSVEKGQWKKVYDEAIFRIAKKNVENANKPRRGMPVTTVTDEMIKQEAANIATSLQDESFDGGTIIRQVLEIAQVVKAEMVSRGDPEAELMRIPDPKFKVMKKQKTGTAMPTTLGVKADQIHRAELRAEILKTISEIGTDDPVKVSAALNSGIRGQKVNNLKAKGKITEQEVEQFILRCKEEKKVRVKGKFSKTKTYDQLSQESAKQLEDLKNALIKKDLAGFDNLEEAFVMATLSLASPGSDAIDPETKAHISSIFMPPPDLFSRGQNSVNYTSSQITALRRGEVEEQEARKTIKKASPEELEREIGVSPEESVIPEETTEEVPIEGIEGAETVPATPAIPTDEPVDFPITDIENNQVPQQTEELQGEPTPPAPEPVETSPATPEPKVSPKRRIRPIASSLGTLIRIARDLDEKGKFDASEKVHEIIRKYQKGL